MVGGLQVSTRTTKLVIFRAAPTILAMHVYMNAYGNGGVAGSWRELGCVWFRTEESGAQKFSLSFSVERAIGEAFLRCHT